jgi:gamma-glutamyltranspeptidase/glutathione hydrolase
MGYLELLKRHGKLKPAVVLAPAIKLAKAGFWVTPKYRALATDRADCLRKDPEASRIFLRPGADGKTLDVPEIGALIKQPELAKTLEALAASGAKAFYAGRVAKAITETVKTGGGILTAEDLAEYKVRDRAPLTGSYRGHTIHTMPPPSAGGLAVVQVLGMMELGGEVKYRDPLALHRYLEAVRRVYVDRAKYLGDPAFNDIPLQKLASPAYIAELYKTVDDKKATPSQSLLKSDSTNTTLPPESKPDAKKNTTHISVLDRDGNAVAMTTTVNYGFGSCVVAKGTGVLLNNEMDDFAARPMTANVYGLVTGEANAIAPGKVPLSSMSPTFVFQKEDPTRLQIVVGSPGGPTIPTTVIQVISNVLDHGMDLPRAVAAGRIHHQYMPDSASVDKFGLDPATAAALEAKGHTLKRVDSWGDAEAVGEDPVTKLRYSASDPRNEGAGQGQD